MNYKAFDVDAWANDTLAMVDGEIKKAREEMRRLMDENERKWKAREALRDKLIKQHGELVGLILYRLQLERI